jgi:DNA-binding NtrC family response regulator
MPERLPWIAADAASERLLALAEKVAPAPTTLLITGESGSGKDHFARLVHELSPRRTLLSSRLIALHFRLISSKANFSATSGEPLPARSIASLDASN